MKKASIIGIIFTIGLLVILKVFQNFIPRISDPVTNIFIFIGFIVVGVIYSVSQLRGKDK